MTDPGLNVTNLKYFYDAVDAESISESARRNFVTQSAVSQGIQKLERALSTPLISHQRNCFKVTPEGEAVFALTLQLLKILKEIETVTKEAKDVVSGQINVVCTQSVAMNLFCPVLQKFKQEYPQVTVKMKIGKMESISTMLKRGVMDFGVVVESEICDQFERSLIRRGFFNVYSAQGMHYSLHDGIYVDHCSGLYVERLLDSYRKQFQKELHILQELDSWQVLAKCAENGIGCCFLPDFLLAENHTMKQHTELLSIPYRIVAIHPRGGHLSRAAATFIDFLGNK
ncbi:MAG: LysR family transcriptional regulator [Verrucomicrobia bacterium]|nr:LysR family transcriptional regulator [Verrucomicrobiota bacterium]